MLRRVTPPSTPLGLDHHGQLDLAVRELVPLGRMVHDLVHGNRDEVDIHELHDRSHAHERTAHAAPGNRRFRYRGVLDLLWTERLEKSGR